MNQQFGCKGSCYPKYLIDQELAALVKDAADPGLPELDDARKWLAGLKNY